ncbi:MAG: hypothetical protein PHC64_01580 [Candidatus Gastranaerophilales bacterium]|nr:hypothetical protein [Candidatus Gastranaerophilales bacterium]
MEIRLGSKQNSYNMSKMRFSGSKKPLCTVNNQIKNDIFIKNGISFTGVNARGILDRYKKFEIAEYMGLTSEELKVIRESLAQQRGLLVV